MRNNSSKSNRTMKTLTWLVKNSILITAAAFLCVGCAGIPRTVKVARITQPPAGKALVNFHRPSNYGGAVLVPIFDGNGKMLIDLPGGALYQHVCDPGEQIFVAWAERVSVVKADVAPDKIYDVLVDVSMGWVQANIFLSPVAKDSPRRAKLAEFEKRERATLNLNPASPHIAAYETNSQPRIQEIKRDFLGGQKDERLKLLKKDDCR